MLKITFNGVTAITQSQYDDAIAKISVSSLICPSCNQTNCFTRHGYYKRSIWDGSDLKPFKLLRLKCKCGKTHTLIPSLFVPRSRYISKDYDLIVKHGTRKPAIAKIQLQVNISQSMIRYICRNHRKKPHKIDTF